MQRALFTAASGMHAQETRMSVTANNLANANTTGYKRARTDFEDLLVERVQSAGTPEPQGGTRPAPLEIGLGVRASSTTRAFQQGDMIATENPLDVAIEGAGFFQVQMRDGSLAYTRAGNFRVDGAGRLVTQNGDTLEPNIRVPDDTTRLTIREDGMVTAEVPARDRAVELGMLELALFPNPAGLHALGGNLYAATDAAGLPINTQPGTRGAGGLTQGFLEGSNVRPVEEMIALIATQRAYEMNSKVIEAADEMMSRLGRLG